MRNSYSESEFVLASILKRQIEPAFEMIESIVSNCASQTWEGIGTATPIWQQVYHCLFWTEAWLRDYDMALEYPQWHRDEYRDMKGHCAHTASKEEMLDYLHRVKKEALQYIGLHSRSSLLDEIEVAGRKWTICDIVISQIKHLQHHIGYMNGILRANHDLVARWMGYGEEGLDLEWYGKEILKKVDIQNENAKKQNAL